MTQRGKRGKGGGPVFLPFACQHHPVEPQLLLRNLHQDPSSPLRSGNATYSLALKPGMTAASSLVSLQAAVPNCTLHHFPHLHDYSPIAEVSGTMFPTWTPSGSKSMWLVELQPRKSQNDGRKGQFWLDKKRNTGQGAWEEKAELPL